MDPVPEPHPPERSAPRKTQTRIPRESARSETNRLSRILGRLIDGASLGALRMAMGFIMLLETWSLCRPSPSANGAVPLVLYYTGRDIRFTLPYDSFGWLPLFPPAAIHAIVAAMAIGSLGLLLGILARTSGAVVFLAWGYLYAVESTRTYWMSYYYLELLVLFLLPWMPTDRGLNASRWLARDPATERTIPAWPVLLLRGQLVIAYFYAGLAKLTTDWMLDAQPVRYFLSRPATHARLERLFGTGADGVLGSFVHGPGLAYLLSWTGALFDLLVGPLLLLRSTRATALGLLVVFHATNHFLLFDDIGWFPLLGIASATIFLDPDWPVVLGRRAHAFLGRVTGRRPAPANTTGTAPS